MRTNYALFHVHTSAPGSRYRPTRPGEVTLHDGDGHAYTYDLSGLRRGVVEDWKIWAAGVFDGQITGKYPVYSVEESED